MEKSFVEAFAQLGDAENREAGIIVSIEAFVCQVYNKTGLTSVDEARYSLFLDKCKLKKNSLDSLKAIDPSLFPPCKPVLLEKI